MPSWMGDGQDVGEVEPCSCWGPQAPQDRGQLAESAGSTLVSCALQDLPCGNASGCVHKAQMPSRGKEWEGNCTEVCRPNCLSHCLDRDLPAASFCSQHLPSFAPISSGHILPLAAGYGGTSHLCVVEIMLKPENIAWWALFFSA